MDETYLDALKTEYARGGLFNWGEKRRSQKTEVYEVDPLTCPKSQGSMRVIAFIENEDVPRECSCRVFLKFT